MSSADRARMGTNLSIYGGLRTMDNGLYYGLSRTPHILRSRSLPSHVFGAPVLSYITVNI